MINETLKKKPDDPYSMMSSIISSVIYRKNLIFNL